MSRIEAKSEIYEIDLTLDVNFDIYPMELEKVKKTKKKMNFVLKFFLKQKKKGLHDCNNEK